MPLDTPTFMPPGDPSRIATDRILEHRPVPGISYSKPDDGIIEWYDCPRIWVAWYQGQMVLATWSDDDYEGPPERARGWDQTYLIAVTPELLKDYVERRISLRALYDQPDARTWFVHEDWQRTGPETWDRQMKIFDGVPFPEDEKPRDGILHERDDEEPASPAP